MDFLLIAYVLVVIALTVGLFFLNFSSGKPILAAISSLGVLGAAILFGLRWFPGGTFSIGTPVAKQGDKWPPVLNVCPDYLSYVKVNNTAYCYDPIGVSRRNGTTSGMNKSDGSSTDVGSLFNLHADKSGEPRISALVEECKKKGVLWEGVYNGSVAMGGLPPSPP